MRSFLRISKLRKLAVRKLYFSRGGSYSVSRGVRTWIKFTPEYPFKVVNSSFVYLGVYVAKTLDNLYRKSFLSLLTKIKHDFER